MELVPTQFRKVDDTSFDFPTGMNFLLWIIFKRTLKSWYVTRWLLAVDENLFFGSDAEEGLKFYE